MVKDRSAEFQSRVRDAFEEVELGNVGGQPTFEARLQFALSLIDELSEDIDTLKRKQAQILALPVVEPRHKSELEDAIAAIREKTRQLRPRVQQIEDELQSQAHTVSETHMRMKKNQVDLLRKRMHKIITSFNESQVEYRERVSKRVKRGLQMAGEHLSEDEVDRMLASHSSQVFYREVNPLSIAGRLALEDATARHDEILELERSLSLLQEMFQDMYDLVHSQGEMVDAIDKNVDNAHAYVEQAATNTKQAVEYKKSAMRKKVICLLLIVCLVLILVAVAIVLGVTLSGRR